MSFLEIKDLCVSVHGKEILKDERVFNKAEYKEAGEILADEFINQGAKELLAKAEQIASQI